MLFEKIPEIESNKSNQYFYLQMLSARSNALYNFLLLAVLAMIVVLPLVHIQVTSSASASLQPKRLKETVYTPIAGKTSWMGIENNHQVKQGDTLLTIDNLSVINELTANKKKYENVSQSLHDIVNILSCLQDTSSPLLFTPQYEAQYQNFLEQRNQFVVKLDNVSKTYQRTKYLLNEKVVSISDFEQVELSYNQAKIDLELLLRKSRSQWQTDKYQLEQERTDLKIKVNQLEDIVKKSVIVANTSGVSYITEGLQPGTYIQSGQKIAEIIPDTGLIAVCWVTPKDIAFIKLGQQVQLQIDSYNFYDWGMAHGNVTEIFKDVDFIDNKPYYAIYCNLDKPFLILKNGYKGAFMKGMTGKASFTLNKITLWQLLFTKANDWFNPNRN